VGPGRFHYSTERSEVDTVYLGAWRRETLEALGGYDETQLQWAAEDQELNLRLRASGGRIVLDPGIRSWYFPRNNPRALWRQYYNYGLCKASTLKKHRKLPTPRPLAPAALVAVAALAAVRSRGWRRIALPVAHAVAVACAVARLEPEEPASPVLSTEATLICHWAYGLGFWAGVGRILRGKPFDTRPGGHR
jgi:succinoglycan biosynthesis protein ExoA